MQLNGYTTSILPPDTSPLYWKYINYVNETYIENLYQNAQSNFKDYIEMIYIQAKSKISKESIYEFQMFRINYFIVEFFGAYIIDFSAKHKNVAG